MWVLIYLLICLLPVLIVGMVIAAIAGAGMRTYRAARFAMKEFKPYTDRLAADAVKARERGMSFAGRGQKIAETFEEAGGRWVFVVEELAGATRSPVVRLAGLAGKLAARD